MQTVGDWHANFVHSQPLGLQVLKDTPLGTVTFSRMLCLTTTRRVRL